MNNTLFEAFGQAFADSETAHREIAYRWIDKTAGVLDLRTAVFRKSSDQDLANDCWKKTHAFAGWDQPQPGWFNEHALTAAFSYWRTHEVAREHALWLAGKLADADPRGIGNLLCLELRERRSIPDAIVSDAIAHRALGAAAHVGAWWAEMCHRHRSDADAERMIDRCEESFGANPYADVVVVETGGRMRMVCALFSGLYVQVTSEDCFIYRAMAPDVATCRNALADLMGDDGEYLLASWEIGLHGVPIETTTEVKSAEIRRNASAAFGTR